MMTNWASYAAQGIRASERREEILNALTPEERKQYEAALNAMDTGRNSVERSQRNVELAIRRKWAGLIREEFGKYHDHSESGGECGACGAIQGANFMHPDYLGDGPKGEGS